MRIDHPLTQIAMRGEVLQRLPFYALRVAHYAFLQATKRSSIIKLRFGADRFRMLIEPLGAHEGSRGIFLFRERYEPLLRFGSRHLKRGDVALDLGANQGVFACAFCAAVGPTGRVVAVEPLPWQAQRVARNLNLNGFTQGAVVGKAISDTVGAATLGIPDGDTSASLMATGSDRSIDVETTTIDEIVRSEKLERLDLIKMDVEGVELKALSGGERSIRRFKPRIALEASDPVQFREIRAFMRALGYKLGLYDRRSGAVAPLPNEFRWIDNVICEPI